MMLGVPDGEVGSPGCVVDPVLGEPRPVGRVVRLPLELPLGLPPGPLPTVGLLCGMVGMLG